MDYNVNVNTFKLQITKIMSEIAGSSQGAKILMSSKIAIKYIIFNLMNSATLSTQILTQKLSRMKENLERLINERIVAVLLLNMLKKEYLKQAMRVQIVEVLNEINVEDNLLFIHYVSEKFPPRIVQKCFADRQQKLSAEIVETFEMVTETSDLLWTNLMRIEAIMVLEKEIVLYLKDQNEKLDPIIPQYPEFQNEVQCSQILLRIFNFMPSYTKFQELSYLVHIYSKNDNEQYSSYAEVLLENLIDLTEKLKNNFIELQEQNIAKTKEYMTHVIDDNQLSEQTNEDPALYEFDRISISYITALTSLMFIIEYIIIHEKKLIKEQYFKGICNQFSILSENKSHSHLKSTVLQIAYLLKDQQNIHKIFAQNKLYYHITNAINYTLDTPQEQDSLTLIEQTIILNLLIKLIRDKDNLDRQLTIEQNKNYCLPAIARLLESIDDDNSFMKSYIISYCAEMLKSGFFFEEISAIIDQTTFSSKQLAASKNTYCEWVNLWRPSLINYDEGNSLTEMQLRLFQDKYCELFFSLPIQSEYSIKNLPFPPQDYLVRLKQVEEFKINYERDFQMKKNPTSILTESFSTQSN